MRFLRISVLGSTAWCAMVWAAPVLADATAPVASSTIERLIAELGANRFRTREIATAHLVEVGSPAKPFLEEAATSGDAEVRLRAEQALELVQQAEFRAQLRAFVADIDGRDQVNLPGWRKFRSRFGEAQAARDLFVSMQRSEPALMRAFETGHGVVLGELEQVCAAAAARAALRSSGIVEPVEAGTVAAVLLVTSDPEIQCATQTLRSIFSLIYQQPFLEALQSEPSRTELRELLGAWISRNTDSSSPLGYQNLQLALRHGLSEGLAPALKIVKEPDVAASFLQYAVLTIGKFGSAEHLSVLEPLLANEAEFAQTTIRERQGDKTTTRRVKVQIRDLVLAVMIHLAGEEHTAYGYPGVRTHTQYLFTAQSLYFQSDSDRDTAIAKWRNREAGEPASQKSP